VESASSILFPVLNADAFRLSFVKFNKFVASCTTDHHSLGTVGNLLLLSGLVQLRRVHSEFVSILILASEEFTLNLYLF
jgi:hypothetical protein